MNVLLIGSGGREHALAFSISKSPLLSNLFIAPGNPGTNLCGENVELTISDNQEVVKFCASKSIDLVIVGPEAPLVNGIHDAIKANSNTSHTTVVGPKKIGAMLEGSKDFSKQFMMRNDVPTAGYMTFDANTLQNGLKFLQSLSPPFVLKCDGLAAGKGVLIEENIESAQNSLREILEGEAFGSAGAKVVIEEFMDGVELSVFILTDGKDYLLLPTAKDYKRIGEGDTGLNTGGMGALSPAPVADEVFMDKVREKVIERTLTGLQQEGIEYHGFLFIGLMRVGDEPFVIEYNVRMGDPETEAVLPRIESDLLAHFHALGTGRLGTEKLVISNRTAATVMMVSGGYPESYEKGKRISGLDEVDTDSMVYHAGTKANNDGVFSNGGRVLAITSLADTLEDALTNTYRNLKRVGFEGSYYRTDIGYELTRGVK